MLGNVRKSRLTTAPRRGKRVIELRFLLDGNILYGNLSRSVQASRLAPVK
jgi:hypothetical protein